MFTRTAPPDCELDALEALGVDSVDVCPGRQPVDLIQASLGEIATPTVFTSPNLSYS